MIQFELAAPKLIDLSSFPKWAFGRRGDSGSLLALTVSGSRTPFYRSLALGLIGGFIAYFTYGITDAVALGAKPGFAFWWALGLVVATLRLSYQDIWIE